MDNRFQVVVGAGTMILRLRPLPLASRTGGLPAASRWKPAFTGGHLLHLAAAGCVLNDLYREILGPGGGR